MLNGFSVWKQYVKYYVTVAPSIRSKPSQLQLPLLPCLGAAPLCLPSLAFLQALSSCKYPPSQSEVFPPLTRPLLLFPHLPSSRPYIPVAAEFGPLGLLEIFRAW